MEIRIGNRMVGDGHPPLIIAEMSGNHAGSLERALQLVDAAADAGAGALKLQTYTAQTITLDVAVAPFVVDNPGLPWHGRTLHDLYAEAHTPWEWHETIFKRARDRGMLAFSSPFDETAVDFLERLDVPAYKIASFEITHLPLIRYAAATGKPLIISTGMATLTEIEEATATAHAGGAHDIVLLKCTSAYPGDPADSNIRTIANLREVFGTLAGLSDHTLGIGAAVAAVALGACAIEKHFTLSRDDGAVDSTFSLTPEELRALVRESETAWRALGGVVYGPSPSDRASLHYRRSIYASAAIHAGEPFTAQNTRIVRPVGGLEPKHIGEVLGATARTDLNKGDPVTWQSIVTKDGA